VFKISTRPKSTAARRGRKFIPEATPPPKQDLFFGLAGEATRLVAVAIQTGA
jgi:hypothetical protein